MTRSGFARGLAVTGSRFLGAVLASLVASCDVGGPFVSASLDRGPCFGPCPVYSVTVDADGNVLYRGSRFVKLLGEHRAKISRERVSELQNAFFWAGFYCLDDAYPGNQDFDSVRTTYSAVLRTKSVADGHGDKTPARLTRLEAEFDRIVGTERWTGTKEERARLPPPRPMRVFVGPDGVRHRE